MEAPKGSGIFPVGKAHEEGNTQGATIIPYGREGFSLLRLFGKTMLVADQSSGSFGPIHSGSEGHSQSYMGAAALVTPFTISVPGFEYGSSEPQ